MDLDYEGFPQIASQLLNTYVNYSKDQDVFVLIDFYKCYRAFVRCKVNCMRLQEGGLGEPNKKKLLKETLKYLDMAYRYAVKFTLPHSVKSETPMKLCVFIIPQGQMAFRNQALTSLYRPAYR